MARIDLHCHTSASFDGTVDPVAFVRRAADAGLTHVAITDHDTIDGALRAVESAPDGLTVLVGCEVLTTDGDLIVVGLGAAIPTRLAPREAIAAAREQGAAVGIPHPFDRSRRSLLRNPANADLVPLVDWIETRNGRASRSADEEAAALARRLGVPGIAASDAHTLLEVGITYTELGGNPADVTSLKAALRGPLAHAGTVPASDATDRARHWWRPWRRPTGR